MQISQAVVEDAEEILRLQRIAYQGEAALHGDFNIPPLTQTLRELRDSFRTHVFLKAVAQGTIVGSVRARAEGRTCHIGRLIVHPDHQRKGIGTALMTAIEALFPEVRRFELFTGHRSEQNLSFYAKRGYREYKRERASPRVTLVLMEKKRP